MEGVECACIGSRGRECVYMQVVECVCMDEERKDVCIWKGWNVRVWEGDVCVWKGWSVHAWGEGGCVHMEGVECACMGRGRVCA